MVLHQARQHGPAQFADRQLVERVERGQPRQVLQLADGPRTVSEVVEVERLRAVPLAQGEDALEGERPQLGLGEGEDHLRETGRRKLRQSVDQGGGRVEHVEGVGRERAQRLGSPVSGTISGGTEKAPERLGANSWEPWHYGYSHNPGSTSVGFGQPSSRDGSQSAVPSFVPSRYRGTIVDAARRWSVSAALISAQIEAESGFDARAVSPAGAQGIAQFMPATARAYGLRDPFDPDLAIQAQAHLMHDLLRRFASVPLALAAYNAGEGAVAACGCVPPYPETQAYVARILSLIGGQGLTGMQFEVRLVE